MFLTQKGAAALAQRSVPELTMTIHHGGGHAVAEGPCGLCGTPFTVDLDAGPVLVKLVERGCGMAFHCPNCDTPLVLKFRMVEP